MKPIVISLQRGLTVSHTSTSTVLFVFSIWLRFAESGDGDPFFPWQNHTQAAAPFAPRTSLFSDGRCMRAVALAKVYQRTGTTLSQKKANFQKKSKYNIRQTLVPLVWINVGGNLLRGQRVVTTVV